MTLIQYELKFVETDMLLLKSVLSTRTQTSQNNIGKEHSSSIFKKNTEK